MDYEINIKYLESIGFKKNPEKNVELDNRAYRYYIPGNGYNGGIEILYHECGLFSAYNFFTYHPNREEESHTIIDKFRILSHSEMRLLFERVISLKHTFDRGNKIIDNN